jgi:pantoate--beta-alanine ligase
MQIIRNRQDLWRVLAEWRRQGQTIALVPTMGNLHEGHLSLVHVGREHADRVITSVYVNPTQFGAGEDFDEYPRTPEEDAANLEREDCDMLFLPDTDELYPYGVDRSVLLHASPDLAGRLEGRFRPGHFDGVVTIVARFFAIVQPDIAVFGEKDYQQLLEVQRMTKDLGFNTEVIGAETVRAKSGLALSSRNAYLNGEEMEAAQRLNEILAEAAQLAGSDEHSFEEIEQKAAEEIQDAGLQLEYIAIRRAEDLAEPQDDQEPLRILAAAWCGRTRLIDNMAVGW